MSKSGYTSQSDSDPVIPENSPVDPTVAAAYKQGPAQVTYKGKHYIRKEREGNQRAFTRTSII